MFTHSVSPKELDKQEIFRQIDQDLSTKRTPPQQQKTRSNYKFIILLNIIIISAAGLGIFIVYTIFQQQSLKLIVGQDAIQSLELILIQQAEKRRNAELLKKEEEVQELRIALNRAEQELAKTLSEINQKATQEFEKQRVDLQAQIKKELQGKTESEKAEIRRRYELELHILEEKIENEKRAQELAQQEAYKKKQEQLAKEQELLQIQLQRASQNAEESRKKTLSVQEKLKKTETQKPNILLEEKLSSEFDQKISFLFSEIGKALQIQNTKEAEKKLQAIENLYNKENTIFVPIEKRNTDLFLVSLIRNYINTSEIQTNLIQQLALLNQEFNELQRADSITADAETEKFRIFINEFSESVEKDPENIAIPSKIRILQKNAPDVFTFYDSYKKYRQNFDSQQAKPLIKKANQTLERHQYPEAIQQYQYILQNYPGIKEQNEILNNFAQAIQMETAKNGSIPLFNQQKTDNISKLYRTTNQIHIVYMKAPDGYILDIIDNTAIITLFPGVLVKKGDKIDIFRANVLNKLELEWLDNSISELSQSVRISAKIKNPRVRIGDLIYLNKMKNIYYF
ncbi:hypothetical protein SAMN02745150_01374 [Brevinema andersonii]|uniref:Uncharacterized protein n=2 Tax=Brevinema andersonii TaxID=34097 RepID=A0A1I1F760_BREAD|nr:hypothetical protein SAMN02745150_01374 [Brevinema andersonii]